ncbi:MAG: hypothetical protein ABIJ50_12135 [Pseudomonadota bacterium]
MHPDKAYEEFLNIFDQYNGTTKLNEADTRAKIIDFILRNCLGWSENFIQREHHTDAGYTDYELIINDVPVMVIEAKKAGEYFEIPVTKKNRNYKINGSISTSSNLISAIEQVQKYCSEIGCKYAAVFNGHQLVLFSAITIGKPWKEEFCLIFNSLQDIKENFNIFWNLLAYENVKEGSLVSFIEKGKSKIEYHKILTSIHNPDQSWPRNELYTYIQPYCDFVFSELLDEKKSEILKECYVYDRSSKPLTTEIKSFFADNLPFFAEKYGIRQIYEDKKKAGGFQKAFDNRGCDEKNGSLIVLLGGIGSGKSTFLHRFFKIVISEKQNHLWFYLDFRNASLDEGEIENFILQEMVNIWKNKYQETFKSTLKDISFDVDINDRKEFFKRLFALSPYLRFSTTIVIDNVDQHELHFQEQIFLTGQHLKDFFNTLVVIAIREETFVSSTRTGVFDAFHIQKFHISSPNFLQMIIKRIDFTIKLVKNDERNIPKDKLIKYLDILRDSLIVDNKQAKHIVHFIDSVSVGNMREALRMFNNFIVSGNTNINEIFARHQESGSYQLSFHQFIKSIMFGEYKYYSQDRSHIMNLFDFDPSITDSCFNLLKILNFLLYRSNKRSSIGRGYVEINELIDIFESVSIKREVVIDSLIRLSTFNLCEYDNQSKTGIKNASYVKLTAAGKYYLLYLVKEFQYLDAIIIDTPISDISIVSHIKKLIHSTDLNKRIERTRVFLIYLIKSEEDDHKRHPEYLHHELTNKTFCKDIFSKFELFTKKIIKSHETFTEQGV